jgi:hypothetical protein
LLKLVDLGICFDDDGRQLAVAFDNRVDRRGELAFGQAPISVIVLLSLRSSSS